MLKEILDQELRSRRLGVRAAARQMGVAHMTLYRILKGDHVDLSTISIIAGWLGVNPSTLIDENVPGVNALASNLTVLLQSMPALSEMLASAVDRVEAGELDVSTLTEVLSYMAFKLQRR